MHVQKSQACQWKAYHMNFVLVIFSTSEMLYLERKTAKCVKKHVFKIEKIEIQVFRNKL